MKKVMLSAVLCLTVSLLCTTFCFSADYCFQSVSEDGENIYNYRFAVEALGGTHYSLDGYALKDEAGIEPTHGNAEIAGNEVRMTLNRSGMDEHFWSDTLYVVLDKNTLSSTYKGIFHEYDFVIAPVIKLLNQAA